MRTSMPQLPLRSTTPQRWVETVQEHFDEFLLDHAACERKASALAMSFVVKYGDRPQLVEPMIALAREELAHFHDVYKLIAKRGLSLSADRKDGYVNQVLAQLRHGRDERLLDRLVASALIEARGCERFFLLGEHLVDEELARFYQALAASEAGHYKVFLQIAKRFFSHEDVDQAVDRLLDVESEAMCKTPVTSALH